MKNDRFTAIPLLRFIQRPASGTSTRQARLIATGFRHFTTMKQSLSITFLLTIAACMLCGCQLNARQAAIEEESRRQEATIRELCLQVEETEQMLAKQDREIEALRHADADSLSTTSGKAIQLASATEETQVNWGSVNALQIHRLTSGLVQNPSGNGSLLNVVLQPVDEDAELVKVAGALTLNVSAVQEDGSSVSMADQSWSITESRKLWTRGLVSSGFHLRLQIPDSAEVSSSVQPNKLLVTCTLDLGANRRFSTTELFDVE